MVSTMIMSSDGLFRSVDVAGLCERLSSLSLGWVSELEEIRRRLAGGGLEPVGGPVAGRLGAPGLERGMRDGWVMTGAGGAIAGDAASAEAMSWDGWERG